MFFEFVLYFKVDYKIFLLKVIDICINFLNYLVNEFGYGFFFVISVIIFNVVDEFFGFLVIGGVGEFEGLESGSGLFEVGIVSGNFVDEVFKICMRLEKYWIVGYR